MPFTVSHVAAVLPLRRTPLPMAGLVIGSMAPDLPYFLPFDTFRGLTHSWAGIVTIDLAIGLIAWLIWRALREPVLGLSPGWLRERVGAADPAPWSPGHRWWASLLLLLAAITIGNITHLVLDAPTHAGFLADHIAFLRLDVGGILMTAVLHRALSLVLAVVLVWWAWRWVHRTPRTPVADVAGQRFRVAAWVIAAALFLLAALGAWVLAIALGYAPFSSPVIFTVLRVCIGVFLGTVVVACIVWLLRRGRPAVAVR